MDRMRENRISLLLLDWNVFPLPSRLQWNRAMSRLIWLGSNRASSAARSRQAATALFGISGPAAVCVCLSIAAPVHHVVDILPAVVQAAADLPVWQYPGDAEVLQGTG